MDIHYGYNVYSLLLAGPAADLGAGVAGGRLIQSYFFSPVKLASY